MAKNKGSKGSAGEETVEAAATTSGNGALLFEVMDDGFDIPASRMGTSQFESTVKKVLETEKGKSGKYPVIAIFEQVISADKDQGEKDLMKCYTRAKQLKQAAKRLEANITVAVRRTGESPDGLAVHKVLAQKTDE